MDLEAIRKVFGRVEEALPLMDIMMIKGLWLIESLKLIYHLKGEGK